jgi:hypothetical protein
MQFHAASLASAELPPSTPSATTVDKSSERSPAAKQRRSERNGRDMSTTEADSNGVGLSEASESKSNLDNHTTWLFDRVTIVGYR